MKLTIKLILAFGLLLCLQLGSGVSSILEMKDLAQDTDDLAANWLPSVESLGRIDKHFQGFRRNEFLHILSHEQEEMQAIEKSLATESDKLQKAQKDYEPLLSSDDEKARYSLLKQEIAAYLAANGRLLELSRRNQTEEATAMILGESREHFRKAYTLVEELVEINRKGAAIAGEESKATYRSGRIILVSVLVVALIVGVAAAGLLIRGVSRQLGEDPGYLHEVAEAIAAGNLEVRFRPQKREGGVYHVLRKMVDTLKSKIGEAEDKSRQAAEESERARQATAAAEEARVRAEQAKREGMLQAAGQLEGVVEIVTSASEELSAQVEQSSRGSEEQSRRVGETATAMEEMNATVLEVARNASQAAETAEQAKTQAQAGAKVVDQAVRGIGEVESQALNMKEDMSSLGTQAEGIGRILNVITDIADQTNLLALNAAIEAARAGDAGRGFAVVADEVRKLAEKTMAATKEVGEAIHGIQQRTRRNIENVDKTVRNIQEATTLAAQSGQALTSIVTLVDQVTDQVHSIATASEQQSSASEEINKSIEDVNRISSETADAMRQSAQAVGELAEQAQALRRLIEEMKSQG